MYSKAVSKAVYSKAFSKTVSSKAVSKAVYSKAVSKAVYSKAVKKPCAVKRRSPTQRRWLCLEDGKKLKHIKEHGEVCFVLVFVFAFRLQDGDNLSIISMGPANV